MEPVALCKQNSLFNNIMRQLRDERLQADRFRFRFNMERAGELIAYEMSKHMAFSASEVVTQLGQTQMQTLSEPPVLVAILRAALAMHTGFLRMFDEADSAFISAYRKHTSDIQFIVKVEYVSSPDIAGRRLVFIDPMIATGKSMVHSYERLMEYGQPGEIFIGAAIASEEGLEYVQRHMPQAKIFVGDIDRELTAKGYIVPGLGDAGDLAFGDKL